MTERTFNFDPGTAKAIHDLKAVFGVASGLEVIRKAVALARIAERNSTDHTITMVDSKGTATTILLNG
jgi:hypothetical protein